MLQLSVADSNFERFNCKLIWVRLRDNFWVYHKYQARHKKATAKGQKGKRSCLVLFQRDFSKLHEKRIRLFLSCHVDDEGRKHFKVIRSNRLIQQKTSHFLRDIFPFSAEISFCVSFIVAERVCESMYVFICLISNHLSSFLLIIILGFFMISPLPSSPSLDAVLTEWHTKNWTSRSEWKEPLSFCLIWIYESCQTCYNNGGS